MLLICLQVIQIYISWVNASVPVPKLKLVDFRRVPMTYQLTWEFYFHIKPELLQVWKEGQGFVYEPGNLIFTFIKK